MRDITIKKHLDKYYASINGKGKKPLHQKAQIVDEIIELTGKSPIYNYGYWLRKLKEFEKQGGRLGMIYGWLKEIRGFPEEYSKGGALTNKFKKWRNETKK